MKLNRWAAFEEFVRAHGDALVRLSFALCGDRGKAEDAAQEALTRVYLRWSRLDDPLPYARRSVVNATRDSWRSRSRQQQREQVVAGYAADLPLALDDLVADRDRLIRALLRLPYGQRAVIVLRYWLQLSAETTPAQVARALARGDLRVSVKGTVNGHPAIELVYAAKANALHYWVDAASYRPVRIDLPPFSAANSIAESWIPKTASNVAQTDKPQVPAGFRQVPPSAAFH